MRVLMAAVIGLAGLLVAPSGVSAGEPSPVWKDGWTINVPGASNWVADGASSPYALQHTPATPYVPGSTKDPFGFADYSIGRTLGFGRDYGLGDVQATLGVRMSEPLATNGFTPAYDPRRYLGVGPRMGFEGNKTLPSSWVVEWHVGAAVLFSDRTFDSNGGVAITLSNTDPGKGMLRKSSMRTIIARTSASGVSCADRSPSRPRGSCSAPVSATPSSPPPR